MSTKKMFSVLLVLLGEAIIILCFLYFGKNLATNILILNIVVTSAIYLLWFIEKFIPMVDLKDKAHKGVGSLGIKWLITLLYAISATTVMVVFNTIRPLDIYGQMIIHGVLFFLLLVGIYFMFYASEKVGEVYSEEHVIRNHVDEMKRVTKEIKLKAELTKDFPPEINTRVTELLENLRFISPCGNYEAVNLEVQYLKEISDLKNFLFDIPVNYERGIEILQKCEQVYNERKRMYSK